MMYIILRRNKKKSDAAYREYSKRKRNRKND